MLFLKKFHFNLSFLKFLKQNAYLATTRELAYEKNFSTDFKTDQALFIHFFMEEIKVWLDRCKVGHNL